MSFKTTCIDDAYEDTAEVSVITDYDLDVHGHDSSLFVFLNTGDMVLTPKAARELAAALILAAEDCE